MTFRFTCHLFSLEYKVRWYFIFFIWNSQRKVMLPNPNQWQSLMKQRIKEWIYSNIQFFCFYFTKIMWKFFWWNEIHSIECKCSRRRKENWKSHRYSQMVFKRDDPKCLTGIYMYVFVRIMNFLKIKQSIKNVQFKTWRCHKYILLESPSLSLSPPCISK